MTQKSKKIGIVGAGLSGLACAVELKKNGFDIEVFDAASKVGGRVQTERFEGFLLDKGFQVYLPSYEMGQYYFDYDNLKLKGFSAGANIFYKDCFESFSDPLRDPSNFLRTLSSSVGSFKDKILVLKLKLSTAGTSSKIKNNVPTHKFLEEFGFTENFISNFFLPFFNGIFLEEELKTPSSFFKYLFSKFSSCEASLPDGGMESLSVQLADSIGSAKIRLQSTATEISSTTIIFENGEEKKFDQVVLAITPNEVNKILNTDFDTSFNSTQTYYYKTRSNAFADKKLFLNSLGGRVVNHVACLSAVNKTYAPDGWHLFSVSTVGRVDQKEEIVLHELERLFGEEEINTWQHLKTYKVKCALPSNPLYGNAVLKKDDVYVCGDFTESPSIQGALSSGFQVAKEICKLL